MIIVTVLCIMVPQVIYLPGTYHTHRHTLKATMFSQKNADMKAKYNINPEMQTYGLDNNKKLEGHINIKE